MRPIWLAVPALAVLLLAGGCATLDQRIAQLQSEKQRLAKQTEIQEQKISSLSEEKQALTEELAYVSKRSEVLEKEKMERIRETQDLRRGVRQFTDEVRKVLTDSYKKTEIVDYVGSELYQRQLVANDKNQLLVDLLHPLGSDGTMIGGRVFLAEPARLVFCLLRPSKDKNQLIVTDMSKELAAQKSGEQYWVFEVPMAAQKGDLIGIYFPEAVKVSYDDADTGYVVMVPGPIKINSTVMVTPAEGRNKRAYSFGMMGFMDKP